MKISNSKKQLAKIIHENGGWRNGAEFASQGRKTGAIGFVRTRPRRCRDVWQTVESALVGVIRPDVLIPNWHQTILSRDEYFHLYPAPVKVVVENKTTCHLIVSDKPIIEQLAADYRNRKDYADRKQQEADAAKADAEVKLAALVAAGEALGLVLGVDTHEHTGKFYSARLGADAVYSEATNDVICDECGRRWGEHYEDESYCKPRSERENA